METKSSLTNEQKLEVLKKAIVLGAKIDIRFHQTRNLSDAYDVANQFSNLMETDVVPDKHEQIHWVYLQNENLRLTVFHDLH